MTKLDITGQRFGRLVAKRISPSPLANTRWECLCDCGEKTVAIVGKLRSGHTKSCGCLQRERTSEAKRKHGQSNKGRGARASRLYNAWCNMRARCNRSSSTHYEYYGGKGIKVCAAWDDFLIFEKWALSNGYSEDLTIDRIDTRGNYEPDNCRWVSQAEQNRNTTRVHLVEFNGRTACLKEHARNENVPYNALLWRYHKGVPMNQAVQELKERVR